MLYRQSSHGRLVANVPKKAGSVHERGGRRHENPQNPQLVRRMRKPRRSLQTITKALAAELPCPSVSSPWHAHECTVQEPHSA